MAIAADAELAVDDVTVGERIGEASELQSHRLTVVGCVLQNIGLSVVSTEDLHKGDVRRPC